MLRYLPIVLIFFSSQAQSGVVIDQALIGFSTGSEEVQIGGDSEQRVAQTFNAGLSGSLDHVSLVLSCASDSRGLLTVEIQNVDGSDEPDGTVLGSTSVESSTLFLDPIWFQDIAISGVSLTAGTQYAIVIRADSKADCVTREGPPAGAIITYTPGGAYSAALPEPADWVRFPSSTDDIPFYTWMYVPDTSGPLFCEFRDASGIPNDWLPNHVPICGCLSDPVLRANRCWFALPDFMLWREIPLPLDFAKGKADWSVLPLGPDFPGLSIFESFANNGFFAEEVQFKAGLTPGKVKSQKVKYSGVTDRTEVELFFDGVNGPATIRFETFLGDPGN
jgi:hypothetical protein